jgi:translation initiation factor 3 subunit A
MSRFARPETVLKRSEELIGVGQPQAALQALYDVFTSRKFKSTQLSTLEPIMLKFVELCVDLRRGRTAKEGLLQYKNVSQNQNPASIELVIKHFIKLSEDKVLAAQEKADAAANEVDVDDLEESETPESMLLSAVTSEENRDRTDRALVTPWLKFLWESYRTALDILRNNARLEVPYQQVAHQALRFCLQYQRKTEFRRLCDLLRTHLANVARYSHHSHAINITEPDTLQRHLDTRFAQLNAAVELELWQEAFRSVEDVHNLLTMAKKAPRPAMMANYYEKLTKIFMVSDNNLFHAASWNRFYGLARGTIKSEEEHTRMASFVLLSALAVPVISSSAPGTGNMNKSKSDFLLADQETRSRTGRLTSLLGLSRTPTRAGLLKEALNRNILKRVKPELRELYNILEVEFHPLSICAKIEPIISQIAQDEEMAKYVQPLHSVILTRLFQQLSQVYDSVKLAKVMELVSAFKVPYAYSSVEIEKFVLNACKKGHLNIRVDHVEQAITFQDDPFEAKFHPAALASSSSGTIGGAGGNTASTSSAASVETDAVQLQQSPSELVRTQLSRLAVCLDATLKTIDPSILEAAQEAKRETFARAVKVAEQEHKAAVARKAILARRKELLEERATLREREESEAKAERQRLHAISEQTRIAEEQKKRELDRIKREMEAVRIEEARKMAQSLKEKGGLKLTEEEFANMDTDKLVQLQVEQLEKEKRELAERLRVVHRRMDHMERAYRREEIPLVIKDYERQKQEDLAYHQLARQTLIQTSREKHNADLQLKQRLARVLDDYHRVRGVIEGKRKVDMEERKKNAKEQIEIEKQKRRVQYAQEKEEEQKRAQEEEQRRLDEEEKERLRAEEEERQAELQRIEQEKQQEMESVKRKEIEERQAKLQEQSEKQRQKEREIEEKLERERRGVAPPAATGESAWRAAKPMGGAVAEARQAPPSGPPRFAPAGAKPGMSWREREAARKAAGPDAGAASASNGSGSPVIAPAGTPPLSQAPSSPARAPAVAATARPSIFGSGAPRSGSSWRDKENVQRDQPGVAASSGNGSGRDTPPTQAAPSADDGFTTVAPKAPSKSGYIPPHLRNRQQ